MSDEEEELRAAYEAYERSLGWAETEEEIQDCLKGWDEGRAA